MSRPHPLLVSLAAGRVPAAVPQFDDGLFTSAIDHGMHGLLWTWVRDQAPDYSERTRLAGLDAATRQRHTRLGATLIAARDALAAIGVDVAAVKGVTAEARWYGREGERPCTDVDLLVDPAAADRAGDIVEALEPHHPLRADLPALVRSGAMQSVTLHVEDVPLDVHFDLLKLGFPMRQRDAVWAATQAHFLPDGTSVRVLDAETSLVHFLVHANKDCFPRLLGYADVVRVMAREDVDWGRVERFVRGDGLEVIAAAALATVTSALRLAPAPVRAVGGARTVLWRVVWPESVTLLGSTGTDRSRRQEAVPFLVRGRFVDALRAAARVAFPPRVTVLRRYPEGRGSYLWRLARGRIRTGRSRRAALGRRTAVPAPASRPPAVPLTSPAGRDPALTARLLRDRARESPLWLPVSGRSMGRSIPSGAHVRVAAAAVPRRGEVWAFCNGRGEIVVHRARGASNGAQRFQGDACVHADRPVEARYLVGRVVEVAPDRAAVRWGPFAGALQRVPRMAVARTVRAARRLRSSVAP